MTIGLKQLFHRHYRILAIAGVVILVQVVELLLLERKYDSIDLDGLVHVRVVGPGLVSTPGSFGIATFAVCLQLRLRQCLDHGFVVGTQVQGAVLF